MNGPTYRVSGVTMFFMFAIALTMDAAQMFLTILVFTAPLADLVTFIAAPMFGMWFLLLGVNIFGGKRAGAKVISAITSTVIELIPFIDALPSITAGVAGIIWASRGEDKDKYEQQKETAQRQAVALARQQVLLQEQYLQQAANDNALAAAQAANDDEEAYRQAA